MFDSKTMLRFISGEVDLREEFRVSRIDSEAKDSEGVRLKLMPRDPDPSLVRAELVVDTESKLIQRIKLVDFFGNKNILRFENIEIDCRPNPELFVLEPPEGTRVVDQTDSGGSSR
jgi:outer membrane lipoprotein carrier protein